MSICDEIRRWDSMSPNERFTAVRDRLKQAADDWGFGDDVTVVRQPVPGYPNRRAGYDPDSDTIYLHPDLFKDDREGGWKYAYDSAAHELAHHVQDEVDDAYAQEPEDLEDDPDGGHDGEMKSEDDDEHPEGDEDDENGVPEEIYDEERHAEATDFAQAFMDAAEDACKNDPDGAESALRSFLEDWILRRGAAPESSPSEVGDWNLPPGGVTHG